jgi:hypothetical protein
MIPKLGRGRILCFVFVSLAAAGMRAAVARGDVVPSSNSADNYLSEYASATLSVGSYGSNSDTDGPYTQNFTSSGEISGSAYAQAQVEGSAPNFGVSESFAYATAGLTVSTIGGLSVVQSGTISPKLSSPEQPYGGSATGLASIDFAMQFSVTDPNEGFNISGNTSGGTVPFTLEDLTSTTTVYSTDDSNFNSSGPLNNGDTYQLTFGINNSSEGTNVLLNNFNFSVAVTPEPGCAGMLAIGGNASAAARARKQIGAALKRFLPLKHLFDKLFTDEEISRGDPFEGLLEVKQPLFCRAFQNSESSDNSQLLLEGHPASGAFVNEQKISVEFASEADRSAFAGVKP